MSKLITMVGIFLLISRSNNNKNTVEKIGQINKANSRALIVVDLLMRQYSECPTITRILNITSYLVNYRRWTGKRSIRHAQSLQSLRIGDKLATELRIFPRNLRNAAKRLHRIGRKYTAAMLCTLEEETYNAKWGISTHSPWYVRLKVKPADSRVFILGLKCMNEECDMFPR